MTPSSGFFSRLRLRALPLLAALPALAAAPAGASALPPVPELDPPALRGAVEDNTGFYVRADLGVAANSATRLRSSFSDGSTLASLGATDGPVSLEDSFLFGLGVGYQFTPFLRGDLTGEYRNAARYQSSVSYQFAGGGCAPGSGISCGDQYNGSASAWLALANAYVDIGNFYGFTPYVGAGVGLVDYRTSGLRDLSLYPQGAFGFAPTTTGVNLAWALTGGVAYSLAPNVKLDFSYRYVNMGDVTTGAILCNNVANGSCHLERQSFALASNDLRIGVRVLALAPPALPPVVQAKF